jgi:predicted kinase
MKKQELIMMVGNIGSGKSTLTKQYVEKGYIVISRDSLRYMLGGGKYIFDCCLETHIKKGVILLLQEFLKSGRNIIWDETNMSSKTRKPIILLCKKYNYNISAVIFPILPMKVCVKRRMSCPHGNFTEAVWKRVWTMFDSIYEEPTKKEGFDKIIWKK